MLLRIILLGILFGWVATPSRAQSDIEKLYKDRCAGCHGADGKGSPAGEKVGVRDFHSPDVQKETDEQLTQVVMKGRNKMPPYEKRIPDKDIKALVAFVRDLAKK